MTAPFSRRALLGGSVLASAGFLLRSRSGRAADVVVEPALRPPVLVCVFLRGAADGLNIVVPHGEPEYYRLRPSLAVPRPGENDGAIDLDGRFGLHPRLAPLKSAFDAKQLAVVAAVGSPHPTRSHFEAQDYMETAAVGDHAATRGWLGHYLTTRPSQGTDVLRAVAVTARTPLALRGFADAVVAADLRDFRLSAAPRLEPALSQGFQRLYQADPKSLAEHTAGRALAASQVVRHALGRKGRNGNNAYGRDGQYFANVARLIKADVGLETAWVDVGGWDTHRQQGSAQNGELPRQLERLGRVLAAFRADLGPHFERVAVLVMSEFGRTARENGTGGTDHGHGNVMLLLGGQVRGGRVLGNLPGLNPAQLYQGRDVPVTTDFRDVLGEVCERHLLLPSAAPLFPAYTLLPQHRLGLFA